MGAMLFGGTGLIGGELLTKLLLRTRPYETVKGAADAAHREALKERARVRPQPGVRIICIRM
jgi:uncharacterized protein YbjT (DUF2867 family)